MASLKRPQLISEPLEPMSGFFNTSAMARGEPGLPCGFTWRGRELAIAEVLDQWKGSGASREGSREQYLRKHWFKIRTKDHQIMTLYFDRQARSVGQQKHRWWLYTLEASG